MHKPVPTHKPEQGPDQDKLIAILSYITLIGWIIALVMNTEKKSKLGSFHIRQSLLIMALAVVAGLVTWIPPISVIIWVVTVVLWIMGFVSAIQSTMKPVPVLGEYAQDWFKSL
ncbi:MAG: hypothetical protein KKG59_05430 [Nanoarchaeota archaeon]|nr:hypothetical protein [Nanoarchaeota archaeon]